MFNLQLLEILRVHQIKGMHKKLRQTNLNMNSLSSPLIKNKDELVVFQVYNKFFLMVYCLVDIHAKEEVLNAVVKFLPKMLLVKILDLNEFR